MVEIITRKNVNLKINPKTNTEEILGTFISKDYYDRVIEEDCDLYAWNTTGENNEDNLIFKFRKNIFTKEEQDAAYAGLREAAVESQNRGMAAGPRGNMLGATGRGGRDWVTAYHHDILEFLVTENNPFLQNKTIESIRAEHKAGVAKEETRGQVWLRSEVCKHYPEYHGWFDKWVDGLHNLSKAEQIAEATNVIENYISETNYAQSVMSGIAGYFDRYPRIPYGRATSYTEKHLDQFALCYPYLQKLNSQFRELIPNRWKAQKAYADKLDPRFLISDTVFTTLTVNHNWRTACHRDAGDLTVGFSNICGVTSPEGKGWRGGQFILPEYNIAINLQPGDMLLVNNHEGIHANDELIGDDNDRMTIVAYFREKMITLRSWEYENLRKQFVDDRRLNKSHPLQRPLWNGVSADMWKSEEWASYLADHNMVDEDGLVKKKSTIEGFFS
jgi:hypothetical protein